MEKKIQRVKRMETILDRGNAAVAALLEAVEAYLEEEGSIRELEAYYLGREWREDFEADEAGMFPSGMKRGVLSEDAVYNLLADEEHLRILMTQVAQLLEKRRAAADEE